MRRIPASSFRTEGPTISLGAAVLSNSHILAISTVWVLDDLGLFSGCWTDGQLMIIACEIVKTIAIPLIPFIPLNIMLLFDVHALPLPYAMSFRADTTTMQSDNTN